MSNRRDIEPSLDYFELRRKHEEYKNSQRQKSAPEVEAAPVAEVAPKAAPEPVTEPVGPEPVAEAAPAAEPARTDSAQSVETPAADVPEDAAPAAQDGPAALNLSDTPDDASDDGDVPQDELADDAFVEDEAGGNPNPFDSFIHAFKGIRGKLSGRFGRRRQDDGDYDDEPLDDDVPVDDNVPLEERLVDEVPAEADEADSAGGGAAPVVAAPAENAPADSVAVEDISDEAPAAQPPRRPLADDADAPQDGDFDDDGDYDDDDYDDDYDEDDRPERVSRFKKFLRLFVVPISEEERAADDMPEDDVDDEYGDRPDEGDRLADDADRAEPAARRESADGGDAAWAAPRVEENEGGPDMSDLNNVNTEVTDALAAGIEGTGMSRRERRELAMRLAAEKAAAEAAAQAEAAKEDEVQAAAVVAEVNAQEAGEVVQAADGNVVAQAAAERPPTGMSLPRLPPKRPGSPPWRRIPSRTCRRAS